MKIELDGREIDLSKYYEFGFRRVPDWPANWYYIEMSSGSTANAVGPVFKLSEASYRRATRAEIAERWPESPMLKWPWSE